MQTRDIDTRLLLSLVPCTDQQATRRMITHPNIAVRFLAGLGNSALSLARNEVRESALVAPRLGDPWVRRLRSEIETLHGAKLADAQVARLIVPALGAAINRGMPLKIQVDAQAIQIVCGIATIAYLPLDSHRCL